MLAAIGFPDTRRGTVYTLASKPRMKSTWPPRSDLVKGLSLPEPESQFWIAIAKAVCLFLENRRTKGDVPRTD